MMYSPGFSNVAVVDVLPASSSGGLAFANVTVPGPRNLLQNSDTPRPRAAASGGRTPSSVTQTVSSRGSADFVVNVLAIPLGGPVNVPPFGSNLTTGGVLPIPVSLYGVTTHKGFRLSGIVVV